MRSRPVSLVLLGGFRCRLPDGAPAHLTKRKARLLLAYLACAPGKPHPREKLATLLWGDVPDDQARQSLRQTIHVLRRAFARVSAEPLTVTGESLTLEPGRVDVDVETFRRFAARRTPAALVKAAALYGGDLLDGINADGSPFDDWLAAEREGLQALAVECLSRLLGHRIRTGPAAVAVATARRLLAVDPCDERAHRALIRLFSREGRYGAARRQYRACIDALARELAARPSEETQALYRELLSDTRARRVHRAEGRRTARLGVCGALDRTDALVLVGRDRERAHLIDLFRESAAGTGYTVLIQGEAGIGKSRLVEELIAEARRSRIRVLSGHAYETEQILPFGPWVEAIETGGVVADTSTLTSLPAASVAALGRLFPELPGGSGDGSSSGHYRRLFEAIRMLLARVAAEAPLLIVLEDLQWADDMSLRLLAFLARRLGNMPVVIVTTAREEDLSSTPNLGTVLEELDRLERFHRLSLSPLSRAETSALVRPLARSSPAMAEVEEAAWRASEGNPFVAVETVRAIQDGTLDLRADGPPLASRVRETILARLERLGPYSTRVAETAAVIGRSFELALIARVLGIGQAEAAEAVETLMRRRILRTRGQYLVFSHDRIREAIYSALLLPRRAVLHAGVADAVAALYANRLESHFAGLGGHAREAGRWEDAVRYFRSAGLEARRRFAFHEAAAALGEALQALEQLADLPENVSLGVDLRFEMRHALFALGELSASTAVLAQAEALAGRIDDRRRLGWCHAFTAIDDLMRGDLPRARPAWEAACAKANASGDAPLAVAADLFGGMVLCAAGEYRTAIEHLGRAAEILSVDPTRDFVGWAGSPVVMAHAYLAITHGYLGEFDRGIAHGRQALAIAEDRHQPAGSVFAGMALGGVHLTRGAIDEATPIVERARHLASEWDVRALQAQVTRDLGICRAFAGATADGIRLLEQGFAQACSIKLHMPGLLNRLAQAYMLDGRREQAAEVASRGLAAARQYGQRGHEAWALLLLGEIGVRAGDIQTEAELRYSEAAVLAERLGMRPVVAHCHAGIGMLHRRAGRREEAEEHLVIAGTMYLEMGMHSWREKLKAQVRDAN